MPPVHFWRAELQGLFFYSAYRLVYSNLEMVSGERHCSDGLSPLFPCSPSLASSKADQIEIELSREENKDEESRRPSLRYNENVSPLNISHHISPPPSFPFFVSSSRTSLSSGSSVLRRIEQDDR